MTRFRVKHGMTPSSIGAVVRAACGVNSNKTVGAAGKKTLNLQANHGHTQAIYNRMTRFRVKHGMTLVLER